MIDYFSTLAFIIFGYMNLWFVVSLIKQRNDVADIAWGLGFVLLAWTSFFIAEEHSISKAITSFLVTLWGLRLSWHIYFRNKGKVEDYRYMAWRKAWGKWFYLRSYFQVYILQGFFLYLIALPVMIINVSQIVPFNILAILGFVVWIIGFLFESVGDRQLIQFVKNPANKGKILMTGLWAYTRHPNYFGEVTQWWGIWLMSLSTPLGVIAIVGPLTITFLILKVSGIPLLEEKMAENPEFQNYQKKVSLFFPLPPK